MPRLISFTDTFFTLNPTKKAGRIKQQHRESTSAIKEVKEKERKDRARKKKNSGVVTLLIAAGPRMRIAPHPHPHWHCSRLRPLLLPQPGESVFKEQ